MFLSFILFYNYAHDIIYMHIKWYYIICIGQTSVFLYQRLIQFTPGLSVYTIETESEPKQHRKVIETGM